MNRQRRGFTLIELLVVIAIIALLMGILMPALQRVKKQAQGVTCLSNLRQIGVAASLYAQDYDWFIPRGSTGSNPIWFMQYLPYVGQQHNKGDYKSVKIYRCKGFPCLRDRPKRYIWPTTKMVIGVPLLRVKTARKSYAVTYLFVRICLIRKATISTTDGESLVRGTRKAAMRCSSTGTPSTSRPKT